MGPGTEKFYTLDLVDALSGSVVIFGIGLVTVNVETFLLKRIINHTSDALRIA
jgi:hypothetical protein